MFAKGIVITCRNLFPLVSGVFPSLPTELFRGPKVIHFRAGVVVHFVPGISFWVLKLILELSKFVVHF